MKRKCKRKKTQCNFKCKLCEYYDVLNDFCKEKEITECSKKSLTEFSNCDSYLIKSKFVLF